MNGRVARLIHEYAATYSRVARGSGRAMERIAKRQWNSADRRKKRRLEHAMVVRIRTHGAATQEKAHAGQDGRG